MTDRLLYGKTITLKADTVTFNTTNPVNIPNIAALASLTVTTLTANTANITTSNIGTNNVSGNEVVTGNVTCNFLNCNTVNPQPGGDITFPHESDNPTLGPLVINGSGTQQGTQAYTSNGANTTTVGSAISALPNALTWSVQKFGHFHTLHIRPTGLTTPVNTTAAATIQIAGAIPVGYRPVANINVPVILENNGSIITGEVSIDTSGNITYSLVGGGNFTNAAMAAILGDTCVTYSRA